MYTFFTKPAEDSEIKKHFSEIEECQAGILEMNSSKNNARPAEDHYDQEFVVNRIANLQVDAEDKMSYIPIDSSKDGINFVNALKTYFNVNAEVSDSKHGSIIRLSAKDIYAIEDKVKEQDQSFKFGHGY